MLSGTGNVYFSPQTYTAPVFLTQEDRVTPDLPFPCKLHEQLTTKFYRLQLRSVCASLSPERPVLQNSHDESIAHRYNPLDLYRRSFKLSFVSQTNSHLGVVGFLSFSDSLGLQEKGQVKTVPLCPSLSDCVPLATVLCGFFAPAVFRMLTVCQMHHSGSFTRCCLCCKCPWLSLCSGSS